MGRPAINCCRCRSRLFLPPGMYINPLVRCGNCYSITRIFNPALPFLGGVKIYSYNPPKRQAKKANPPKRPSPKAKKANPPKRPAPKAKKVDPPKRPSPSSSAKNVNPPKPPSPSPNAKTANPPKPPSPSPNAQKVDSSNSTDVLRSNKEHGNPGIQRPRCDVSRNEVSGNTGNRNGKVSVGNKKANNYNIGKIIYQNGSHGGDDGETETDGDEETGGEEETDGEEENGSHGGDDGETETDGDEETGGEEETDGEEENGSHGGDDGETETDGETDTDEETDSDLETKLLYLMMMRKQKPKHHYI